MWVKYNYRSYSGGSTSRGEKSTQPMIEVEVSNNGITKTFLGLVDSGADMILMPDTVAVLLKINKPRGKDIAVAGITGSTSGFIVNVDLKAEHLPKINVPVCFVRDSITILLGQEGFFEKFKVKFEKSKETFEISY